jgi:predicted ATPase
MFVTQFEPGIMIQATVPLGLWFLGYPDRERQSSRQAVTRAHDLSHPSTLAFTLGYDALTHLCNREVEVVFRHSEATNALASEVGLPSWFAVSTIFLGWCRVQARQMEEGISQLSKGLADFRAQGIELARPYYQALLADALGSPEKRRFGFSEPELLRIRGDLLLVAGEAEDLAE